MTKYPRSRFKIQSQVVITNCNNTLERVEITIPELKTSVSGVYEILNLKTGQFYIGMTRNLNRRCETHFRELLDCKHHIEQLQNDFNLYGIENFKFYVIIYCRPSELTFYENILIKQLNPFYNEHKLH